MTSAAPSRTLVLSRWRKIAYAAIAFVLAFARPVRAAPSARDAVVA